MTAEEIAAEVGIGHPLVMKLWVAGKFAPSWVPHLLPEEHNFCQ